MAVTSKKPRALTILVQTCIVTLILCFADCEAGNDDACLSYGHTCWGGHGKRSDVQDIPATRILAIKSLLENGFASSSKTQWILSRLIAGQPILPLIDKYRVRQDGFRKDKSYVPPKWNRNMAPITDESIESIRISINNENKDNGRKISSAQGTMRNMNGKLENSPEVLLISPGEYDKPINDPQKLNLLKLLNEANGGAK